MYPIHAWFVFDRLRRGRKADETLQPAIEPDASCAQSQPGDAEADQTVETTDVETTETTP